jgi:hypothetical protein
VQAAGRPELHLDQAGEGWIETEGKRGHAAA